MANAIAGEFVRRGWAEILHNACGPTITVNEAGPVLESDRACVETDMAALLELKTASFFENIGVGNFDEIDEEFVKARRAAGQTDYLIAKAYAERDLSESTVELIGIETNGAIWILDPDTGTRVRAINYP